MIAKDASVAGKRVAVIVDEAHSSQTGDAAKGLKKVLGGADALAVAEADAASSEGPDTQDELVDVITASAQAWGRHPNLSFFAFTAMILGFGARSFGLGPQRFEPAGTFDSAQHLRDLQRSRFIDNPEHPQRHHRCRLNLQPPHMMPDSTARGHHLSQARSRKARHLYQARYPTKDR